MRRTASATANAIYVLVALRRMLGKVNAWKMEAFCHKNETVCKIFECTSSKHSSNVSVSLVKPSLHNRVDKRRSMKKHSLIALIVIFFRHFSPPARISFPKFDIANLLDFENVVALKNATRVSLEIELCQIVIASLDRVVFLLGPDVLLLSIAFHLRQRRIRDPHEKYRRARSIDWKYLAEAAK